MNSRRMRGPRAMLAGCPAKFADEPGEVIALGKAGQLGAVVEPHVDQPPDARLFQPPEESSG